MVDTNNTVENPDKIKKDSISKSIEEKEATLPDPMVLHHSNTPGLTLVNTPLDRCNYEQWSHSMCLSLSAKNKLGLIDETVKTPPVTDAGFSLWQCCNDLVITWILHSIHADIARSVIFSDTGSSSVE
ncbi:Retrovirus-related Pol polyprotein from transposon TNT 1-94 [Melia azedarach]|uniref:Retrovirus-related Pol polyprotein from transposon TNT 1-94 n=1 Tax=Melia azedarach TaxID=155640 RepID=A0ACC1WPR9_MELAZ|nr:Retrovirus-related Pol polyprotein from transposon TNT 1-94 [Melia azedarach]